MKNKFGIKINSLMILLIVVIFVIVMIGATIIGENSIQNVFEKTSSQYFTQTKSLSQNIFDRKLENVVLHTSVIDIPEVLTKNMHKNELAEYLQNKLNKYLDFLIYLPNEKSSSIVTEGFYLYDISALERKIKNNDLEFNTKELVTLKNKEKTLVFILSSKKITNNEGKVVGKLIGGIELGFNSSFFNEIKKQTLLDKIELMIDKKGLMPNHVIPKETDIKKLNLFAKNNIVITKYYNFLFDFKPSVVQIAMSKKNAYIASVVDKVKTKLIIMPLVFIFILVIILFFIKKILVIPLINLRQYSIALANKNKSVSIPTVYISEYKDLTISLKKIFEELIKSKDIQEKQFLNLSKAKDKIDENIKIIDKFVLISTTDIDGNITYVSAAFCKLSGYTKEELLGKNHRIMKNPKIDESTFKDLWETISNGRVWHGEVSNLTKDGTPYWTKNTITPIFENDTIIEYTALRENITSQKMMEELSTKDVLTGLYNRRYIENILITIKNNFNRYNESFCIVMIDIDNFKEVNDLYGHQIGDEVLKSIANILKENSRVTDIIGRWGGEEFLLVITKSSLENAQIVAEKLRAKVDSIFFEVVGKKTISLGISQYYENIEQTINAADTALYKAKKSGRNKVEVAKNSNST